MVTPLSFDDDRIIGIQVEVQPGYYVFLLQVYIPCKNHPILLFKEYVDKLYNIWSMYSSQGVVIFMGDFNSSCDTDVNDTRNAYLHQFLVDTNQISVTSLDICTGAKYSYVSYDGLYETLIDHIILPVEKRDLVSQCQIVDDHCLNVSRHRPLLCSLNIPLITVDDFVQTQSISWKKVSQSHINDYHMNLSDHLQSNNYCISDNYNEIDNMYTNLTETIRMCSDLSLPNKKYMAHLKPYWNEQLSNMHSLMFEARTQWCKAGRPRDPEQPDHKKYKDCKRVFRKMHRYIVRSYLIERDSEINETAELDKTNFGN